MLLCDQRSFTTQHGCLKAQLAACSICMPPGGLQLVHALLQESSRQQAGAEDTIPALLPGRCGTGGSAGAAEPQLTARAASSGAIDLAGSG